MLDGKIVILLFSCVFIIFFLYKIFSFHKGNKYLILGYFFLLLVVVNMALPLLQTKELIVERKQYYLTAEQQAMFDWIVPLAKSLQRDSGILPSITIAQKIGEQGWDWQDDGIETQCHNYFGMKAGSYWTGPVYTSLTQEEYSGNYVTITDSFRCYSSDAEGFQGRGEFLWMDRYREFIDFCVKLDYRNAIYALKKAGYATSSSYVSTLLGFIEDYNLTQYDNDPKYQWDGTPPGDSPYDGSGGTGSKLKKPKVEDLDLTTTFTGNYEKGYLYSRFAKTLLAPHLKSEKRLDKQENFIVKDIFKEAINFEWANMGKGGNEEATLESGEWSLWRQGDALWSSVPVGASGSTIGSIGCLATSVAIQIKRSGTATPNIPLFNPGTFVSYLNSHGGFDGNGAFYWGSPQASQAAPNFRNTATNQVVTGDAGGKATAVKKLLDDGCYMVMQVAYGDAPAPWNGTEHWVAIIGATSSSIQMVDPASDQTDVYSYYPALASRGSLTYSCYQKTD